MKLWKGFPNCERVRSHESRRTPKLRTRFVRGSATPPRTKDVKIAEFGAPCTQNHLGLPDSAKVYCPPSRPLQLPGTMKLQPSWVIRDGDSELNRINIVVIPKLW